MDRILESLKNYDGPDISIMEVCGSHTAAISRSGIRSVISDRIKLHSGPGCPVCVTVTSYIDRLLKLAEDKDTCIVTFGDLIRVKGSRLSLYDARAAGARVEMVYSPMDVLKLAQKDRTTLFVFAAVGFETTTPVYAILMDQILQTGIKNIKLLTSIKTMPEAVEWILLNSDMDGFIAPGHVCAVAGYRDYEALSEKYHVPFAVAGFDSSQIINAIYTLIRDKDKGVVTNLYTKLVQREGNTAALEAVDRFFEKSDGAWRGLGIIEGSARYLKEEYLEFDAGSRDLNYDQDNEGCHCREILAGKEDSSECPLFAKACTPASPRGACMVSEEGACFNAFAYMTEKRNG